MPVFSDACQQAAVADLRRQLDGIALHRRCLLRLRGDRPTPDPAAACEPSPSLLSDDHVMQVFVRTISQGTVVVRAPASETVAAVHGRVERATGVPCSALRFLHRGRQLSPDATLAAAGVHSEDTLHLAARLRSTRRPQVWYLAAALDPGPAAHAALAAFPRPDDGDFEDLHFSGAAAMLVRQYNSTCPDARRVAGDAIREFVGRRGLAVLLFYWELAVAVGTHDALCRESRSAVLAVLKKLGPAIAIKALVPLIADAAESVVKNFAILFDAPSPPLLDQLSDILRLLQEALTACHCTGRSLESLLGLIEDRCYQIFHEYLRNLMDAFVEISSMVGHVLKGQQKLSRRCQTLDVLTVVNDFAEIFPIFRPVLRAAISATREPLDLLLRQAKRSTTLHWFLKCKDVGFSFEAKRNLVLMLLPEVRDWDTDEQEEMLIDRSNLLAESFEYISHASPSVLRYGLLVEFKNEQATGPGVAREWFCLVCRKVFSPENVLFLPCPSDRRRFFPNPASSTNSMNLEYFKFSGRLIALALMHKVQIGITFDRTFFLQLAGKPITLEDVKDADPFLYLSCKWILDMDPDLFDSDALGLTFSRDVEVLGSIKNVELCAGGKDIVVKSRDREYYVNLLIKHSFVTSVTYQVEQFYRGFADILSDRTHQQLFFESLELEDVDRLLYGSDGAISLTDWKEHTKYECYKEKDDLIQWFWKIVEEMSDEQRRVLLFFWTAVKYLPAEGFKGLNSKLCIHRATSPNTALPVSQTCFYRLSIPAYNSESTMRNRLHFITQEHVSCSFGMG